MKTVRDMFEEAWFQDKLCSLHVMFANAGVSGGLESFTDITEELIEPTFKVNVYGVFYCFKHAANAMTKLGVKDGSLIATSSVAGIRSGAGSAIYSASKAAVISIGQTVANQLVGTGIRCNIVCPGLVETGMTKPVFDLARARNTILKMGQLNPLQRYALPKEIASVVCFLASPGASYINGQAIAVDGETGGMMEKLDYKSTLDRLYWLYPHICTASLLGQQKSGFFKLRNEYMYVEFISSFFYTEEHFQV